MTTQNDESLRVQIDLYPEDASEKAFRQIGYGMQPFILIEAVEIDDEVALQFVGSQVNTTEELLENLEAFVDVLRSALEQAVEEEA